MKAKEYYEKYGERLMQPNDSAALPELVNELLTETQDLIKNRKIRSDRAFVAVINQQNDKWNAIARMFPKEVLVYNGFKKLMWKVLAKSNGCEQHESGTGSLAGRRTEDDH